MHHPIPNPSYPITGAAQSWGTRAAAHSCQDHTHQARPDHSAPFMPPMGCQIIAQNFTPSTHLVYHTSPFNTQLPFPPSLSYFNPPFSNGAPMVPAIKCPC